MTHKNIWLLQGIDTIIVRVSNIEISKEWYVNCLGLTSIWDDPKMKLVVLDTKSPTSLTLWQTDEKLTINKNTASYPIFRTQDAEALKLELAKRGIEVSEVIQDEHVKYFYFF